MRPLIGSMFSLDMVDQLMLLHKRFLTVLAWVRLLARMQPHMLLEVVLALEALHTVRTLVGSVAGVRGSRG